MLFLKCCVYVCVYSRHLFRYGKLQLDLILNTSSVYNPVFFCLLVFYLDVHIFFQVFVTTIGIYPPKAKLEEYNFHGIHLPSKANLITHILSRITLQQMMFRRTWQMQVPWSLIIWTQARNTRYEYEQYLWQTSKTRLLISVRNVWIQKRVSYYWLCFSKVTTVI
jgi:hypothetical protein